MDSIVAGPAAALADPASPGATLLQRLADLVAAGETEAQRYLLLLRFLLLNAVVLALVAAIFAQGWLDQMIVTDKFHLIKLNIGVFLFGLGLCGRRVAALSEELNELKSETFSGTTRAGRYLAQIRNLDGSSRPMVAELMKMRFGVRLGSVRQVANTIVLIGLIGTVIGFIIALSGVDADAATDAQAIAPMVSTLMLGMAIALYKTLVGTVLNVWLMMNYRLLEAGAVHLVAGIVDLGERHARV